MEIAIEEMRLSRSEHKDRFDPMVGAVLVGPGGTELGRAHRASLRVGDHAEYTLIERLLGDRSLEDSTLYVTLEPCTKRRTPKTPCAKRIVSARLGRVIIGMPDPNPEIQGRGITHLLNNNIEVDFFNLDLVKQIREENKDFIEQYDRTTEVSEERPEEYEGPSDKEKEPVLSAGLEDFSPAVIQKYLNVRGKSYSVPSPELWAFLHKNGFLVPREREESYVPTVAGLLLFGKNPEDFLPQSRIKAEAHSGEKIRTADITGSLLSLHEKIKEFFQRYMSTYTEIKGFERVEVPEYPWEALREAAINAIVHRDYREGAHIIVQILRDSIAIKSPGHLLRPLSLDKIRAYNAPPYSRNPRIAETFYYMKLMEERGWGFPRMRDLLVNYGLRPPEFGYQDSYFVVTFFARERAPGIVEIAPELVAELGERQKQVVDFVRSKGKITRAQCATNFGISERTATRDLGKLIELGIIERKGGGPSTYYILVGA